MRQYRSLLVPLDGSAFAEQALPLATAVARQASTIIQCVLVHHPLPAFAASLEMPLIVSNLEVEARAHEQLYLEGVVARLCKESGRPVTSRLLDGPVAFAVAEQIESAQADLVVLCTHGRGGFGRFWLGSVADLLLRHSPVPLLLVRPQPVGVAPPSTIRRILVPLDGSPFAEEILDTAMGLADPFKAEIVLLSVLEPIVPILETTMITLNPVDSPFEAERRLAIEDYLKSMADRIRAQGFSVSTRIVSAPSAAAAILEQVGALGADVVAIATHGGGGGRRLLLGSVADKVIRGGTFPVLAMRPRMGGKK